MLAVKSPPVLCKCGFDSLTLIIRERKLLLMPVEATKKCSEAPEYFLALCMRQCYIGKKAPVMQSWQQAAKIPKIRIIAFIKKGLIKSHREKSVMQSIHIE